MADRLVVVSGAAAGIGRAVVEALLEADAGTMVAGIDLEPLPEALAERFGADRVFGVQVDVTDHDGVERAVAGIEERAGTPTGLVCSAGIQLYGDAATMPRADFDRVLAINLGGTFACCQAVGRRMIAAGRGAIVNVSSISMWFGFPRRLSYITSKGGIGGLTQTLAVEWAPYGVRVNAVAPGMIETELVRLAFDQGLVDRETAAANHAMNRIGQPHEVAAAIRFLLSDDASFITGEILNVDGGFRLKKI